MSGGLMVVFGTSDDKVNISLSSSTAPGAAGGCRGGGRDDTWAMSVQTLSQRTLELHKSL